MNPRVGLSTAAPRPAARLLRRERLEQRCEPLCPVTVVHGGPGFGKTTFLAHWAASIARRGHLVLWLDAYLVPGTGAVHGVSRALTEAEGRTLEEVEARAAWDVRWLSAHLRELDRPVVMFLDHATLEPEALEDLARLLVRSPNVHLVASARTSPHVFSEVAAQAAIDQHFVTAADLALTAEEALALARAAGIPEDRPGVEALRTSLGGWPRLVDEVLRASAPSWPQVDPSPVHHFVEEVSAGRELSPVEVSDLLTLAVAGQITSTQWMRGESGREGPVPGPFARLRTLELHGVARRVFLPGEDEPSWEIPPVLRTAVVEHFSLERPEEVLTARRRLARTFAEIGDPRRALTHAITAADWSTVEALWSTYGFSVLTSPECGATLLPELPPLGRAGSTTLRHAHAVIGAAARPGPRATRLAVLHAEEELARAVEAAGPGWRPTPSALPLVTHLQQTAAFQAEDPDRALELARLQPPADEASFFGLWTQATDALAAALSSDLDGSARLLEDVAAALHGPAEEDVRAIVDAFEALLRAREGRVAEAEAALRRSRAAGRDPAGITMLRGLQAIVAAQVALQRLDLEALDVELELARSYGADEDAAWFLYVEALALREALQGQPARGLSLVLDSLRTHGGPPAARRVLTRRAVDMLCALGEVTRAQAMLDGADLGRLHSVAQARIHLAAGEIEAATTLATRLAWMHTSTLAERTALLVVHAAATAAVDPKAAPDAWRQALVLSAEQGALIAYAFVPRRYVDPYLDDPELMPAGAKERLARVRLAVPSGAALVRLTARERVVLGELVRHETLSEVAAALTVSVNTVKKQTLSIYAKLGVNDRASALRRARELGLV